MAILSFSVKRVGKEKKTKAKNKKDNLNKYRFVKLVIIIIIITIYCYRIMLVDIKKERIDRQREIVLKTHGTAAFTLGEGGDWNILSKFSF